MPLRRGVTIQWRSQLDDPMLLVGTVAHELAHVRLLGEERVDPDEFYNEILTDLTVVFHGMRIFLTNHPRHWRSGVTTWRGTDMPKPEYITTPMHGFALAYRRWLREETRRNGTAIGAPACGRNFARRNGF